MSVLITGGTGFVGQRLIDRLDQPVVTSRSRERAMAKLSGRVRDVIEWSPLQEPLRLPAEHSFSAVVNLMGDSIAEGRWTEAKKQSIRDSRVEGTRRLVQAIVDAPVKPDVLVSASAVGYYGDAGDDVVTEEYRKADGFLADVSAEWEQAADEIASHGVRVVKLRIGIVLGAEGGALEKLVPLFKTGMGGRLGSGKQYFPWIHVDDLVGLITWAIDNANAEGVYNAAAPNPVRNAEFTKQLAGAVGRWAVLPVPRFAVRTALGEFADSLFNSQRVVPQRALADGFEFRWPELRPALDAIVAG